MALLFDHVRHHYFLDGEQLPSTTTILRDSGLIQLDGVPPFILEAALKRGTAVHQAVHYYNEGDLDWASVDEAYRPYLDAWVRFVAERGVVSLLCEHRLASRRHRVCGTLDLLAEMDGCGWVLDFKTGNPEDVAADLQIGCYLGMALEWRAEDPVLAAVLAKFPRWRRASVRLTRAGTFRITEYTDPRDYTAFQILAAAWHIRHDRGVILQPDDLAA